VTVSRNPLTLSLSMGFPLLVLALASCTPAYAADRKPLVVVSGQTKQLPSGDALTVNDDAYDATGWNGSTAVPTKNAVRDKIESMGGGLLAANNLSDVGSASTSRTNLGLGTFATQNYATPPAIGGSTPAAGSFTTLTATGTLTTNVTGSTQCLHVNSSGVVSGTGSDCGSGGGGGGDIVSTNNLSDVASASTSRTNLGLAIGTNVQAYDADLAALGGVTSAADKCPYFTGSGTASVFTCASAGRTLVANGYQTEAFCVAASDETTAITTGTAKVTWRMPYAFTLTAARASVTTVSSSGTPAFDVNEGGASIFSTTLTIDASEKTSTTAATPAVISDSSLADDAEMTIDIDTAGTGAKGVKLCLIGHQ
jgi:hypothetical protein